jgi:hypothetical protein
MLAGSTSSMRDGRFFRNPDLQLRDFGASTPDVSLSQNASLSSSRHPVIVTGATSWTSACVVDFTAAAFGADAAAGVFAVDSAAGVFAIDPTAAVFTGDSTGAFTVAIAGVFRVEPSAVDGLAAAGVAGAFETTVSFAASRVAIGSASSRALASRGASTLTAPAR